MSAAQQILDSRSRATVVFETVRVAVDVLDTLTVLQCSITSVITHVNDISGTIASAAEDQSATTRETTRNVSEAAKASDEITSNIAGVADAAHGTANNAHESQKSAEDLAQMFSQLRSLVEQFKIDRNMSSARTRTAHSRERQPGW